MIGPILKGKKVILKPIKVSEARIHLFWIQDPEINRFLVSDGRGFDLRKEKEWIKKARREKDELKWSIYTKLGRLIGNTSLRLNKKDKRAGFGIIIGEKDEWGKGYGTDTLKTVLKFAFNKLKFNRVELEVFPKNKRGFKCYSCCGFKKEGLKRKAILKGNKYNDVVIMGILKNEFKNFRPRRKNK